MRTYVTALATGCLFATCLLRASESVSQPKYDTKEMASIKRGQPLYESICASCHQVDGRGDPSLGPSLAGVEWVTGSKERLALVVGQGLYGPIEVGDELWNLDMPAYANHADLGGEAFNDLLNYIRAAWGNDSSLYEEGEARAYLAKHSDRTEPWIAEEF